MDIFLSLKVLILGIVWAGSFYMSAAYILPIFPMPALHYIRKRLQLWSDNIAWLDEKKAHKRWKRSKFFFRFLVALVWSVLMGICAYLLVPVLSFLVQQTEPNFWAYYAVAATLPIIFGLYWGIRIFRDANKSNKQLSVLEEDHRSAIEKIKQPIV